MNSTVEPYSNHQRKLDVMKIYQKCLMKKNQRNSKVLKVTVRLVECMDKDVISKQVSKNIFAMLEKRDGECIHSY